MQVRRATPDDVDDVVDMAVRFLESPAYCGQVRIDRGHLEALVAWLQDEQLLLVAEHEGRAVGMLGMAIVPATLSGDPVASEIGWWMEPEFRRGTCAVRMWEAAERWAREKGAAAVQMIAPHGSEVGAWYARRGYAPLEQAWQLRLPG